MKYICTGLKIVMMLVVAPGFAVSEKGNKYPPVVEPNSSGEGVIERITEDGRIIINDTLLTFSLSAKLQYETGGSLSKSSLKEGNEVLYRVNSKLEIIHLIVDKK